MKEVGKGHWEKGFEKNAVADRGDKKGERNIEAGGTQRGDRQKKR